jgi:stringent starvation protein B
MTPPSAPDNPGTSTRPYLLRALHDWCTDNGFTPYIAVHVDASVQVPMEYVKNNEIVLNVGFEATANLELGNEFIRFRARFGGSAREIAVPVDHVVAIYARENGQGMAFPMPAGPAAAGAAAPAPRGLRLAATDGDTAPADEPAAAAPAAPTAPTRAVPPVEPPPPEPGPGSGRPALKRVK